AIGFLCSVVMAGLVPAIYAAPTVRVLKGWQRRSRVDARDKPVQDDAPATASSHEYRSILAQSARRGMAPRRPAIRSTAIKNAAGRNPTAFKSGPNPQARHSLTSRKRT
ncbi:MAG TPA: hypothetical protein PK706_26760, partial [Xanthobacteraceae bacterium]|nr:hypothetical protein [Xanthobacteraceae bacterium]